MPDKIRSKVINGITRMGWTLWIFPICAVIICCWLSYSFLINRGPLVTIHFSDAATIEANKTPIRYRGITVGKVETLKLSEDTQEVVVEARLDREAKPLAVDGTRFWIVQPQVDFQGISGLETLFKGPYIRLEPGEGKAKYKFKGFMGDEVSDNAPGTVKYYLKSDDVESVNVGDKVSFRGLEIGSVSGISLSGEGQSLSVQINVETKYVRLIRTNTQFWRKKALRADLGLFGSEVEINSLETMMRGGIALATPPEAGEIANAESQFNLNDQPPEDWKKWKPKLEF